MLIGLGLVIVGVLLAGTGAMAAAAAVSVRRVELAQWVSRRLRGSSRAARLTAVPRDVMATAGALSALGVLLVAVGVPVLASSLGLPARAALTLVVVVPLAVLVGDVVPRVLGRRVPERTLHGAAPLLRALRTVLTPLVTVREPGPAGDVAALLRAGETTGRADADELGVVARVLSFADRSADDVMTPRTGVVAVAEGSPPAEVGRVVAESGYSRVPVYRESLDDIVGMIHALDLLELRPNDPLPVRPVVHVPESRRLNDLLLEMQRERCHLAIVLDEFGGTKGIVTLDNLLDELVGEVTEDPSDTPAGGDGGGMPLYVDGSTPLSAVEAHFGVPLGAPRGAESVGGFLAGALGRIPRAGERFEAPGLEFDVLASSATRLERVVIRPGPVRAESLPRRERAP